MVNQATEGLGGVQAAMTSISSVAVEGMGLSYRGYSVKDLANHCTCFEEVAYLLLIGKLPSLNELHGFAESIAAHRELPKALKSTLELLPGDAHPMDVLRTGTSFLGTISPEKLIAGSTKYDEIKQVEVAVKLFGMFPGILFYWHHFHKNGIRIETSPSSTPGSLPCSKSASMSVPSIAEHWLQLLFSNEPATFQSLSPDVIRAFNVSLILYADHELAASTFAARVTAATLSDLHSAVTSALATLKGSLHGGATEAAMSLIASFESEEAAEQRVLQMVSKKELVMGFGHKVYKNGDPRSEIVKGWTKKVTELSKVADPKIFRIAERIETIMMQRKGLHPNVDFFSAVLYYVIGIPRPFFTSIFALGRIAGWTAHIIEQRANNRLIRPSALYVGPSARSFIPIGDRSVDENGDVSKL